LGEENGPTLIGILNLEKVFDPNDPSKANPEPADVGAWLQEHPRLDVEQPSRVTVGGVSGQQFDAVASEPKEGPRFCSEACVPLFYITNNNFWVGKTEKYRFMVLDNVEGDLERGQRLTRGMRIGRVARRGCERGGRIRMVLYRPQPGTSDDPVAEREGVPFTGEWTIDGCDYPDDRRTVEQYREELVPCAPEDEAPASS